MQENELYEQLKEIYHSILKRDNIELSAATVAGDIDGWDSLTHMLLLDAIEVKFGFKFKLNEIMKFNNVGDMVACIQKKLAAK